jgi:hypothetical protein
MKVTELNSSVTHSSLRLNFEREPHEYIRFSLMKCIQWHSTTYEYKHIKDI